MDTPCDDCEKLKKEIVGLKAKIASLSDEKELIIKQAQERIDKETDEPAVEDKPKRKNYKR